MRFWATDWSYNDFSTGSKVLRRLGGPDGERLEAELRAKLQQISHHIDDLRASLE